MLQVRFRVKDHDDRLKLMEILQDNDYSTWTETDYQNLTIESKQDGSTWARPTLYVTALLPEEEVKEWSK